MSTGNRSLKFKAGRGAYDTIREHGFAEELIGTIVGASGGAKWLVLSQIDRVLLSRVLPRLERPVHLLGSSIGAWRFACYSQADPIRAIERFEDAYLEQSYSEKPDTAEITRKSWEILERILGASGGREILNHPVLRNHILAVRARHLTASDAKPVLATGLVLAMTANLIHRPALGAFFSRALFYDERDRPPFFDVGGFPIDRVPLTERNLADAIIASGSIPMVLHGVRDIEGAPSGTYRDGGVIDYHLDMTTADDERISLFPHFFDWLKPGWFDRQISWRNVDPANLDRTVLICPSQAFIEALPDGKVPDRTDFVRMTQSERVRVWRDVVDRCKRLADELNDVLDTDQLPARLEVL